MIHLLAAIVVAGIVIGAFVYSFLWAIEGGTTYGPWRMFGVATVWALLIKILTLLN